MTPLLGYSELQIWKTRTSNLYSSDEARNVQISGERYSDFFGAIEKTLPLDFQVTLRESSISTNRSLRTRMDRLLMLYGCSKANKDELNNIFAEMSDFKTHSESMSFRQRNDPFSLLYRLVKWHSETETETYGIVIDVLTKAGASSTFGVLTSEFKFERLRLPKADGVHGPDNDVRIAQNYQISDSKFATINNNRFSYAVTEAIMKIRLSDMETVHLKIPILDKTDEPKRMLGIKVEMSGSFLSPCVVTGVGEQLNNGLIQVGDVLYEINKENIYMRYHTSRLLLEDIRTKLSSLANRNKSTTVDITVKRRK